MKIAISPRREHDFYKIGVFEKKAKKEVKQTPNINQKTSKSVPKFGCFLWSSFFRFFSQKWSPKGGAGGSKKHKKTLKIDSERFPGFDLPFGSDLGGI